MLGTLLNSLADFINKNEVFKLQGLWTRVLRPLSPVLLVVHEHPGELPTFGGTPCMDAVREPPAVWSTPLGGSQVTPHICIFSEIQIYSF